MGVDIWGLSPWPAMYKFSHDKGRRPPSLKEQEIWRTSVNKQSVFFLLAETLGKESFFFLLSSDIITVCENYLSWFPNSNWGFCLLIFLHTLPFWILDWDTLVIKSQITRRKRNRNLIAYKRSIYMGEAQENWVTLPNDPSYYLSNISSSR